MKIKKIKYKKPKIKTKRKIDAYTLALAGTASHASG